MAQVVAAACQGDETASQLLAGEYPKMEAAGLGWLPPLLQRILQGEREPGVLAHDLDATDAAILAAILAALA